jgi:hypothetical protein
MELTPELEQRITSFAETWARNVLQVREAKAHVSRDKQGQPQEGLYDWGDEGYLTEFAVCLDLPGFGDIRNTQVVIVPSAPDGLEIDDSASGDQGCASCQYGRVREFEPD